MKYFSKKTSKSTPITPVDQKLLKTWLKDQDKTVKAWVKSSGYEGKAGTMLTVPGKNGEVAQVLYGANADNGLYSFAALPSKLPVNSHGYYIEGKFSKEEATQYAIGWALGSYKFDKYKSGNSKKTFSKLVLPANADKKEVKTTVEAIFLVRDLINTPANEMGPAELAAATRKLAKKFNKASVKVITGEELLRKNFPAIYEVGKASDRKPRLIDLKWGNSKHPKVTLVGKGVCYDTGGLNLKPGGSMALMKKDMGGAAHVLGLAHMIMSHNLPVRLRVLIPAVENSVNGNSYRPGDIIKTRKGLTVEVGNTDAEGRVVLADALTEAAKENPDLLMDFATLTGAARVALGPELPPIFTNDESIAQELLKSSEKTEDPLWRLPLWQSYKSMIKSDDADINNSGKGGFAGAITAALFLQHFIEEDTPWVHIDTYGWNPGSKPGRPKGGEALGVRASYDMIKNKFGKNKTKMKRKVASPVVDVRGEPNGSAPKGKNETQLVFGEDFIVEEEKDGWCKGHCAHDGYVGYIESKHLSKIFKEATHVVTAARTHSYKDKTIKSPVIDSLSFGSKVTVTATYENFMQIDNQSWIHKKHLSPINEYDTDYVETAKKFLETPYYWGGRSGFGIDCSGLVQVSLARAGIETERDTEEQIKDIGTEVKTPQRGDIVFFEGHVGIMVDDKNIIHANATHMKTNIEPLDIVSKRSKGITAIKRL